MKTGAGRAVPVADLLAEAVQGRVPGIALVAPEGEWSWAALSAAVDRRADELREAGTQPGAVVPVTLEADAAGILTLLALWRVGAIPAPLNPKLTEPERRMAVAALMGARAAALSGAQAVLWTSGTSGRPRGVALSADNLRASARAAAGRLGLGPDDVWLASLSVAHVGGLALVTRSLLLGGTLVAWGRFTAVSTSALLRGAHLPAGRPVTHASLVPTQLHQLLEERAGGPPPPPSTFRCALVGGAHAPPELVRRALEAGWPLALTYGMTEMASQVATAVPGEVRRKPGTVGKPLEGVGVRVAGDGEVLVRGPTLALGYVGDDAPLTDPEGWHHTGDLGHFDDEGDLWITGRRAERIVSGGVNVDVHEVEGVLRGHPSVRDACVVGLPDPEWGEVVGAAVVGVEGEFDLESVESWLRERLSAAKRPRRWRLVQHLPLNANGKVDRGAVRSSLLEGA
ncbi:MAG: AMP-binding protein [Longimicrobiales bacterium]|nr:AMP-binding protein [Longimicrobiales bacterium]